MRKHNGFRSIMRTCAGAALLLGATTATTGTAAAQPTAGTDWANGTYEVPAIDTCPTQTVTFVDGYAYTAAHVYRIAEGLPVVEGDVSGDGVTDSLIAMQCGPINSEFSTALIAMTTDLGNGTASPLGTVADPGTWTTKPTDYAVWHGDITVRLNDFDTEQSWNEYYRWAPSAQAFVRIDG